MGKKRKFYRATLPTIVWNPKEGRALAEFVNGQFETEDDEVAETLKDIGYPEVKLDAIDPPILIPDPVPISQPDVKVMPQGMTEAAMAIRQGRQAESKSVGFTVVGDSLVDSDKSSNESGGKDLKPAAADKPKKADSKKKTTTAKATTSKSKTRKIKRRKK